MTRKRKTQGKKRRTRKGRTKSTKRTARRKRFADFAVVATLALAVYFAILGGEFTLFQLRGLGALEQELAAELARTESEIDSLAQLAERLRYDPNAIERVARERYGMIRDGEILYRFHDATPRDTAAIDEAREPQ